MADLRRGDRRRRRQRRRSDRRRELTDRVWLAVITLVVIYGWLVVVPDTNERIVVGRVSVTRAVCAFNNETRQAIRVLIVQSTAASRNIHYPGPPYPERVRKARFYVETLGNGDCAALQRAIAERKHLKRVPVLTVDPKELEPLKP